MSSTKIFAFSRRSQTIDKIMKKFIYIPDFLAVVAGLLRGESFEGRLYIDQQTHVLTLKLWNRKAPKNTRYHKVCDTDFGSLWRSAKHLLWREKFPLSMGSGRILSAMEADKHQAKQAVVDEYIIDNA
jgi:hypothetical protein